MNITITEAARTQIMKANTTEHMMRIGVEGSGCCGAKFLVHRDTKHDDDKVVEVGDIKFLVSPKMSQFINDVEIDYKQIGFSKEYKVIPK